MTKKPKTKKTAEKPAQEPKPSAAASVARDEFVDTLKEVGNALHANDAMAPPFRSFLFVAGEKPHVMAFDSMLAIVAPAPAGVKFEGGVLGKALLGWLSGTSGKAVEIEDSAGKLALKCGRSHTELPMLPRDDFAFDDPSGGEWLAFKSSDAFRSCLRDALKVMSQESDHKWAVGVTLAFRGTDVLVYSCDGSTVYRGRAPVGASAKALEGKTFLLPPQLAQMLAKLDGEQEIGVQKSDWVRFALPRSRAFCRLLEDATTKEYETFLRGVDDVIKAKQEVPLPSTWRGMLAQSMPFAVKEDNFVSTLTAKAGVLKIETTSPIGRTDAKANLKGEHGDFSAKVKCDVLHALPATLKSFRMLMDEKGEKPRRLVLFGESGLFLTAVVG